MSINKSAYGVGEAYTSDKRSGINLDPGPYIGIIKNNVDPARQGRLEVFIPLIGGDEQVDTNWYTVSYASPFFGSTLGLPGSNESDDFSKTQQTYGFWAVPPDLGNKVLLIFVNGDPNQGYWFACVPNIQTSHMVPGLARPNGTGDISSKILPDKFFGAGRISNTSYLPTAELIYEDPKIDRDPNFVNLPKVVHTWQANIIAEQGLDSDFNRGTITSSSQRETPSQVIGLSSPGRTSPDTADFPNLDTLLKNQTLKAETVQSFPNRKGGHSLVMDDGDIYGQNQLFRFRSAAGHQILMNDTEDIFYIINSTGNAWVELTKNGSINVFSNQDFNLRTAGNINLHADSNINFHSGNTIKFFAEKNILVETAVTKFTSKKDLQINAGNVGVLSDTFISLKSTTGGWLTKADLTLKGRKIYLNTNTPSPPGINPPLEFYKQFNAVKDNSLKLWKLSAEKFDSICPYTPTHEPWKRATGELKLNNGTIILSNPQTPSST